MPTWSFRNEQTGEEFDEFFSTHSKKEAWMAENGHMTQIYRTAPLIVSGVGLSGPKIDDGFRDLLKNIKKKNAGSNMEV